MGKDTSEDAESDEEGVRKKVREAALIIIEFEEDMMVTEGVLEGVQEGMMASEGMLEGVIEEIVMSEDVIEGMMVNEGVSEGVMEGMLVSDVMTVSVSEDMIEGIMMCEGVGEGRLQGLAIEEGVSMGVIEGVIEGVKKGIMVVTVKEGMGEGVRENETVLENTEESKWLSKDVKGSAGVGVASGVGMLVDDVGVGGVVSLRAVRLIVRFTDQGDDMSFPISFIIFVLPGTHCTTSDSLLLSDNEYLHVGKTIIL